MSFNWKIFTDGDSVLRRLILITCLGLSVFFVSGCKKAKLRSQLKELMASTIVLPDNITCVNNGVEYPMPGSLRSKAKLIVYLDSTQCASCRISHLESYHHLYHLSEELGSFEVVMLLSNIDLYGIPIARYVSDLELEHPVYVDVENKFLALNPSIPADEIRLHAFLTDDAGSPVCVGDPSVSEKMLQLFIVAVNKSTH